MDSSGKFTCISGSSIDSSGKFTCTSGSLKYIRVSPRPMIGCCSSLLFVVFLKLFVAFLKFFVACSLCFDVVCSLLQSFFLFVCSFVVCSSFV